MDKIIKTLNEYFGNEINFPYNLSESGIIEDLNSGWFIRYLSFKDENKELCLDFTANHRMTNPRHHRIKSNGEIIFLEMYQESFSYNTKIEGDEEVQRVKYYEHNRNVSRILIKKGLMDLKGNESLFDENPT